MKLMKITMVAGAAMGLAGVAMAGTDESRANTAQMLADAQGRTSQLGANTFAPKVGGYMQFRYNLNNADRGSGQEDLANGFSMARTAINLQGNIGSTEWGYFVQGDFLNGGSFELEDAYGSYGMGNGWTLLWGQMKAPVLREELVGDTNQLAAERSSFNRAFTGGRTQGFAANYRGDAFQFWGMFNDGARTENSDFTDGNEADWAVSLRGEYKWAGDWKQFEDGFTSWQNSGYAGMVGAAIHFQDGGSTFNTSDTQVFLATADVSMEGNGWNVFGAGVYRSVDPNAGSKLDDFGFLVQGGIFVAPQAELFGRFEALLPDSSYAADDNFNVITGGVNYYFVPESHAAKFTFDVQYFIDNPTQSALAVPSTLGGLTSASDDGQFNVRAQMQLVF